MSKLIARDTLTAEEAVYWLQMCVVTASFTCKEERTSLILGIVAVGRFFLMVTDFLEGRFLSIND